MGPKMRTVCSVLSAPAVFGSSPADPVVSVGCLEAPCSTGLGWAEGFDPSAPPEPDALVQGAVDATLTAVKRLEGDAARLVLVIESTARHRALGSAAADEWEAIRGTIGGRTPRLGRAFDHGSGDRGRVRPRD